MLAHGNVAPELSLFYLTETTEEIKTEGLSTCISLIIIATLLDIIFIILPYKNYRASYIKKEYHYCCFTCGQKLLSNLIKTIEPIAEMKTEGLFAGRTSRHRRASQVDMQQLRRQKNNNHLETCMY